MATYGQNFTFHLEGDWETNETIHRLEELEHDLDDKCICRTCVRFNKLRKYLQGVHHGDR